jgi:AraC-like DNA-binding protein
MLFQFGAHSSLLLPFVVPGVAATLWLLGRALRRGVLPDALLALLIGLPTLTIAQWMLGYAGWYDSHDWHSTFMFYVPWQLNLLLGPAYYLYFRSLTNQEFRLFSRAWWHLLPGLFKVGLFVVAIAYDLFWVRVVRAQPLPAHFGTKGTAAVVLDTLNTPLAYLIFVQLPIYTWWVLVDYRRYRHYLNDNFSDAERLRFAGLRQLLLIQVLTQVLSLLFTILDAVFDFGYAEAWYYFVLRGLFIYGLIAIGIQANYASATSPLRFEPSAPATVDEEEPASTLASGQAPAVEATPTVAEMPVAAPRRAAAPAALAPELLPLRDKLLDLMQTNQPWLEPELTLTELALRLRTNSALLSKVINAGCGQNFNDFVNTYRVQEAQRKLADPRFAHYSLVGVALESGFNSKSTFNRVFKKLLGQAPSEVVRPKS